MPDTPQVPQQARLGRGHQTAHIMKSLEMDPWKEKQQDWMVQEDAKETEGT